MPHIIRMPEVLAGAEDAAVQTWLVAVGDEIVPGTPLAEIETEKAVVEYRAEQAGTLVAQLVPVGVSVEVGEPIALLADPGESAELALEEAAPRSSDNAAPAAPVEEAAPTPASDVAFAGTKTASTNEQPAEARRFMSPIARRMANKRGIDIGLITGSGPDGRIIRRDIEQAEVPGAQSQRVAGETSSAVARITAAGDQHGAEFEDIPHTRMRRVIARRLHESKSTVPHFYLRAECRVDELVDLRSRITALNIGKVTFNDLVLKAAAVAFRSVPEANAIWLEDSTRRFRSVDIGIAVTVDGGLYTPVVRDVDSKSVLEIGDTARHLAELARSGMLASADLEGGVLAISNLGMYDIEEFTAIINPPQSAILAVGAVTRRPFVEGDGLTAGQGMTVTLSADHRAMDGVVAARWLRAFVAAVESPLALLV